MTSTMTPTPRGPSPRRAPAPTRGSRPLVVAGPESAIAQRVVAHLRRPEGGSAARLFQDLPGAASVVRLPLNMYLLTTADLVRRACAATQVVIKEVAFPPSTAARMPDFVAFFTSSLSFQDRDTHHRLRRVMSEHFTPRGVDAIRPSLRPVVADVVDAAARGRGEVDLVTAVSDEIPVRAMGLLLGLPPQEWPWLSTAGHGMLARIATSFPHLETLGQPITDAQFRDVRARVEQLLDGPAADYTLTATLRRAVGRGDLTAAEATSLLLLLLMTGIDTVAASLTNLVLALETDPTARGAWLDGSVATRDLIEESLRLAAPLPFGMRVTTAPLDLGDGLVIPAGATVILAHAAANVDPDRFPDPLAWRPGTRPLSQTFGHGTHRCLGAMLAVLECELALEALRPLGVRVTDPSRISWRSDISFHTPTHVPVLVGRGWAGADPDARPDAGAEARTGTAAR